jgi:hypothetical protein
MPSSSPVFLMANRSASARRHPLRKACACSSAGPSAWAAIRNRSKTSELTLSATLGPSLKGETWSRPNGTVSLAGIANALPRVHREFLAAGGTGILAGDGALAHGWEKILETYCDFQIAPDFHSTLDYQFVAAPAYHRARGLATLPPAARPSLRFSSANFACLVEPMIRVLVFAAGDLLTAATALTDWGGMIPWRVAMPGTPPWSPDRSGAGVLPSSLTPCPRPDLLATSFQ